MSASASAVPGGRLLIAEFDSQAQAHVFAAAPDPRAAISELTQRLRVGTIVASRVVLTDAMVLDGSYFLTLGPEGVIRELGASVAELPLLVVGRARSLTEALEHRRSRPDHLWASAGLVASREWDPPENVLRSWERWTDAAASGVRNPAVIVVGDVAAAGFLYPSRSWQEAATT